MKKFTKRVLLGVAFVFAISTVSAQDLIVLNSTAVEELQVRVVEVSESDVKYKKWSYQDGPIFTISTSKILYIKYQNGEKQRFDKPTTPEQQVIKESDTTQYANPLLGQTETAVAETTPKVEPEKEKDDKYISRRKGTSRFFGDYSYVQPDVDADSAWGMGGNIEYGYNVVDGLNVQFGLGWTSASVGVGSGRDEVSVSESVLSLPLGLGYNLPLGSLCSLDFNTGLRLNYIIAGSISYGTEEIKYKDLGDYDMEVKRFNTGWDVGVAFLIGNYGVKAQYSVGLSDTADDYFKIGLYMAF